MKNIIKYTAIIGLLFTAQKTWATNDFQSAEETTSYVRSEISHKQSLLHSSRDRDIVVCLGQTGSGKSTSINFLAQKELIVTQHQEIGLRDKSDPSAMIIGLGAHSQTRYPQSLQIDNLRFYDMPGFNDTGETSRHLINAAFIKQILTEARTLRILFVVGEDEVTAARGELFKGLLTISQGLFGKSSDQMIYDSSILLVTKSKSETLDDHHDFLKTKLAPQYLKHLNIWLQQGRALYLRAPSQQGEIFFEDREPIMDAVSLLTPYSPQDVNISVIYPYDVTKALTAIFHVSMQQALKQDLQTIEKGATFSQREADIERLNDEEIFWDSFNEQMRGKEEIALLKSLGEKVFDKALESFQNDHFELLRQLKTSLEYKKQQLKIQFEHDIESAGNSILAAYIKKQEGSLGLDDDIKSYSMSHAEEKLSLVDPSKYGESELANNIKEIILKEPSILQVIDEPEKRKLFDAFLPNFMDNLVKERLAIFCRSIASHKERIQMHISIFKTKEETAVALQAKLDAEKDMEAQKVLREKADAELKVLKDREESREKEYRAEREANARKIRELEERSERTQHTRSIDLAQLLPLIMAISPQVQSPAFMPPSFGGGMQSFQQPSYGLGGDMRQFSGRDMSSGRSGGFSFSGRNQSSASSSYGSTMGGRSRFDRGAIANAYNGSGMTQAQVAQQFGCSQSTVSRASRQ